MTTYYRTTSRRQRRKRKVFRIWHLIVLMIGYATIIYELFSWGYYFYLQWRG